MFGGGTLSIFILVNSEQYLHSAYTEHTRDVILSHGKKQEMAWAIARAFSEKIKMNNQNNTSIMQAVALAYMSSSCLHPTCQMRYIHNSQCRRLAIVCNRAT